MKIEMVDLKSQYMEHQTQIDESIKSVVDSGAFIGGNFVKKFETSFKKYIGANYAIACANGTDALMIALMALNIKPDDEVITTPFTFVATAETIALLGAIPVYADIDDNTYNIDPNKIEELITEKTKAIIPVHIWGQSADMDPIISIAKKYSIPIIEDNAQGVGSSYKGKMCGSMGDMATISFYPAKNLGAYGDGGMVLCKDEKLAEKVRMICNHGSNIRYKHEILGVNSRLDGIQAAILDYKLTLLDDENSKRRQFAEMYSTRLNHEKIKTPFYSLDAISNIHQYGILVEDRNALQEHLKANQIPNAIHYPIPLHLQEAFTTERFPMGSCPIAERISANVVNLPIHPYLNKEQIDYICKTILDFINE